MKKRFLLVAGGALVIVFAAILVVSLQPSEGIYQGKPARVWATQLSHYDPKVRQQAEAAMRAIGPEAVRPLASALGRKDLFFKATLQGWGSKLPPSLKRVVFRFYKPRDIAGERANAARGLALLGPQAEAALPALEKALRDKDARVSLEAARALGALGKPAVPALVRALQSGNPQVNNGATFALGMIGPDAVEAIPALLALIKKGPIYDARAPAYALAKIGPAAVPPLVGLLDDPVETVRCLGAQALGLVQPPAKGAIPPLIALLQDRHPAVRAQAIASLSQIWPTDVRVVNELVQAAKKDKEANVRSAALQTLAAVSYKLTESLPTLTENLKDSDTQVRTWAAILLGNVGPKAKASVPALMDALNDPDEMVRQRAREALDRINAHRNK